MNSTQVNTESYSQKVLESNRACWLVFVAKEKLDQTLMQLKAYFT